MSTLIKQLQKEGILEPAYAGGWLATTQAPWRIWIDRDEKVGWASKESPVEKVHFYNEEEMRTVFKDLGIISDPVSKPQHYIFSKPANDVLDVLKEAGFNMGDHYIASALAYGFRCKKKNGGKDYLQDLKKMAFYINKAIELYEADERSNTNDK